MFILKYIGSQPYYPSSQSGRNWSELWDPYKTSRVTYSLFIGKMILWASLSPNSLVSLSLHTRRKCISTGRCINLNINIMHPYFRFKKDTPSAHLNKILVAVKEYGMLFQVPEEIINRNAVSRKNNEPFRFWIVG